MKTLWHIALPTLATKNIGKNAEQYHIILWLVCVRSVKEMGRYILCILDECFTVA